MQTLDLKRELKYLYSPGPNKIQILEVPEMNFVMVDGAMEPDQSPGTSPQFGNNIQAIYGAANTLKFQAKKNKDDPLDYPVMGMEGLWWVEDGSFDIRKPGNWKYTLMVIQPDQISQEMFHDALAQLRKRKGDQPVFDNLRMERFHEGLCVQTLHTGPYATEPESMDKINDHLNKEGFIDLVGRGGKHHEIYLGDPRRAEPAKLRTILRHPVTKV